AAEARQGSVSGEATKLRSVRTVRVRLEERARLTARSGVVTERGQHLNGENFSLLQEDPFRKARLQTFERHHRRVRIAAAELDARLGEHAALDAEEVLRVRLF